MKLILEARKVADIKEQLTIAQLFPEQINKKEFLDQTIKSIVGTFSVKLKMKNFQKLKLAIQDKVQFPISHIQNIIERMRSIISDEMDQINYEYYEEWITDNLDAWSGNYIVHEEEEK